MHCDSKPRRRRLRRGVRPRLRLAALAAALATAALATAVVTDGSRDSPALSLRDIRRMQQECRVETVTCFHRDALAVVYDPA